MKLTRLIAAMMLICILVTLAPTVFAEEEDEALALNLSDSTMVTSNGYSDTRFLTDGKTTTFRTAQNNCSITLMNEQGIGSLYLLFDEAYGEYTVINAANGEGITVGTNGFLHEYIDVNALFNEPLTSVTLLFQNGPVKLSEIEVYTVGPLPDHVQIWQPPLENSADILLLSTHGDDDQLFFAGLIPTYTSMEGVGVQVAYMTDHRNLTNLRTHEILNGLWATGCTAYPVMAQFPDFRIDSLKDTYKEYKRLGYSEEQLLGYVVELLRRFKPQVVVGHDIDGEYGHGMHMVYTDCLIKALDISNDETQYPELAETYGLWEVPKTYLHLYGENTIELDYDTPLAAFDGMTAFEVSQKLGYPCHVTQQNTWFTDWINGDNNEITKASQIKRHNPAYFGLYRSTVGEDVERNDFLENITTYHDQYLASIPEPGPEEPGLSEEEQLRQEQEHEQLDRIETEQAQQKNPEKDRLEQEFLQLEQKQLEKEKQQTRTEIIVGLCIFGGGILLIAAYFIIRHITIIRQWDD